MKTSDLSITEFAVGGRFRKGYFRRHAFMRKVGF